MRRFQRFESLADRTFIGYIDKCVYTDVRLAWTRKQTWGSFERNQTRKTARHLNLGILLYQRFWNFLTASFEEELLEKLDGDNWLEMWGSNSINDWFKLRKAFRIFCICYRRCCIRQTCKFLSKLYLLKRVSGCYCYGWLFEWQILFYMRISMFILFTKVLLCCQRKF